MEDIFVDDAAIDTGDAGGDGSAGTDGDDAGYRTLFQVAQLVFTYDLYVLRREYAGTDEGAITGVAGPFGWQDLFDRHDHLPSYWYDHVALDTTPERVAWARERDRAQGWWGKGADWYRVLDERD